MRLYPVLMELRPQLIFSRVEIGGEHKCLMDVAFSFNPSWVVDLLFIAVANGPKGMHD